MNNKVVIIDGSHLAYRSYYTFPQFATQEGVGTGMMYGFFSILNSYVSRIGKDFIIAWDRKPYWRAEVYPEYKQRDGERDEEISIQFKQLKQACKYLGLFQLEIPGFEADDIIATLVRILAQNIKIVTGDKDLRQLVDDFKNITVIQPKQGLIEFNETKVKEFFGVSHVDLPLYLSIVGDKSDNIIGIKGLGPVKTAKLINHFKNKEKVLEYLAEVYPNDIERVKLNLSLTDLKEPLKRINYFEHSNIYFERPQLADLTLFFNELEIQAFSARELVSNLFSGYSSGVMSRDKETNTYKEYYSILTQRL